MTETPRPDLDALVREYARLQAQSTEVLDRINAIKATIASFDVGKYEAAGLTVTVRDPNRVFNLHRAVEMLPAEAKALCRKEVYVAAEVKKYLAPVVLDACMDSGAGARIVSIS